MSYEQSLIKVKPSSEKSFGYVFAVIFIIIGLWPLLSGGSLEDLGNWNAADATLNTMVRWWAVPPALILVAIAYFRPTLLARPNYWWFRLGLLMGSIIAPIVMGFVYLITIVPLGLCFRLGGRDVMRLKRTASTKSYWIDRKDPVQSMERQF